MPASRPNILFICSDQERSRADLPDALDLPNHDRLYERGTDFRNFHVTTAPCTPSRSVIYSGLHTQVTGMVGNTDGPPFREMPPERSIGHALRNAGYYTAYKGKWHLCNFPAIAVNALNENTMTGALEPFGFSDFSTEGDSFGGSWEGYARDRTIAADAAHWMHRKGNALAEAGTP